jgi:hypothetical protein
MLASSRLWQVRSSSQEFLDKCRHDPIIHKTQNAVLRKRCVGDDLEFGFRA